MQGVVLGPPEEPGGLVGRGRVVIEDRVPESRRVRAVERRLLHLGGVRARTVEVVHLPGVGSVPVRVRRVQVVVVEMRVAVHERVVTSGPTASTRHHPGASGSGQEVRVDAFIAPSLRNDLVVVLRAGLARAVLRLLSVA